MVEMTPPVLLFNNFPKTFSSNPKQEHSNPLFPTPKTHLQKSIPFFTIHSNSHTYLTTHFHNLLKTRILLTNLTSLTLTLTLISPPSSLAIPSPNSQTSHLSPSTPFSQSQNQQTGLEHGKIRPCPSINPGCVSTNPKSSSFAFPWVIPEKDSENAVEKLKDAIMKTQRNPIIQTMEDTPNGKYLQAEVDGGFGRDVLEFLVKRDVVVYRAMAIKVTYIYPFTTAVGDAKGQEERMKKISDELDWFAPTFESMD